MEKNKSLVYRCFNNHKVITYYKEAVKKIGLWNSERIIFTKYFNTSDFILDLGCGAGRTTIGLYQLGYKNIFGIDLSEKMIQQAEKLIMKKKFKIPILIGDVINLPFEPSVFSGALFSFNGLMHISGMKNRIRALREINRVLQPKAYFIFTTHDRDNPACFRFWQEEEKRWRVDLRENRVYEFGDRIIEGRIEPHVYLHFPDRKEILSSLHESGFRPVYDMYRSDLGLENQKVNSFSSDCRFWIAQKPY